MKQVILSVAIFFVALNGESQINVSHVSANYPSVTFASVKLPLPYQDRQTLQKANTSIPDSITIRVFRNTEGDVVKTLRYYTAVDVLPLHIRTKITRRFPDHAPTAIIEQHDKSGVKYIVNLTRGSQWLQTSVSSYGLVRILHRYHNSLKTLYEAYSSK